MTKQIRLKKKLHIIEDCGCCPYHGNWNYCFFDADVDEDLKIPKGCPLEDYVEAKT